MAVPSSGWSGKFFGRTGNREEGQQKHGWKESESNGTPYGFRRIVIPAAACLLLASRYVTASGCTGRDGEHESRKKLETYFPGLWEDADVVKG